MDEVDLNKSFYAQIVELLQSSREKVIYTINQTMVTSYFQIGKMVIEEEQNGNERAKYGENLLKELSKVLTKEFGKGFSVTNLQQMKRFYLIYQKQQTLSAESEGKSSNQNELKSIIALNK